MQNIFSTKEKIIFRSKNEIFLTRRGNIEVKISYNNIHWYFNWLEYSKQIKCTVDWWCARENCDLDDIEYEKYCPSCPQIVVEEIVQDSYTSNEHTKILQPKNLEEVRQNILKEYEKLPHNGLNIKDLYRIMYGIWVLE
ncbi:hypothetical protein [Rickettsia asembonensis]|uniref:hypothetical protein n=1 Tax=Rickettsia asembonensis TaxID=1068590 RepID=UPI0023F81AC4|nr:hypothetical protein [Rickettsia asembonensis]